MIDFSAELDSIVAGLSAVAGIDTVSTDPAAVVPPGVVVQLVSIAPGTLGARLMVVNLQLVVAETGPGAPAALAALLSLVETYATADGPILARSFILPANPTVPLPGLAFPLNHYTTEG